MPHGVCLLNDPVIIVWPILKEAPALPSPSQLARVDAELLREISIRHQAELKLRDGEQQLKSILDTATDGILSTHDKGQVNMSSPAASGVLGYSRGEGMGE